jgi:tRNA(Ile)-lysidine synthase TilS/MesJ
MGRLISKYNYCFQIAEFNEARRKLGLNEIIEKNVKCLRCDQIFKSSDHKSNRICNTCKKTENFKLESF